ANPSSSRPMRYAAVASRSRSSMSSSSTGTLERSRNASPHRWSPYDTRASSRTSITAKVSLRPQRASREERFGWLGQGTDGHPHRGDPGCVDPAHERFARLQVLAVAAEGGVLPFRGPAVRSDAELLVQLDLPAGCFDEGADDGEEPAEARVIARQRVR